MLFRVLLNIDARCSAASFGSDAVDQPTAIPACMAHHWSSETQETGD